MAGDYRIQYSATLLLRRIRRIRAACLRASAYDAA